MATEPPKTALTQWTRAVILSCWCRNNRIIEKRESRQICTEALVSYDYIWHIPETACSGHHKWKELDCWLRFTIMSWPCEISSELRMPQPGSWEEMLEAERNLHFCSSFQQFRKLLKLVFVKDWYLQPGGFWALAAALVWMLSSSSLWKFSWKERCQFLSTFSWTEDFQRQFKWSCISQKLGLHFLVLDKNYRSLFTALLLK